MLEMRDVAAAYGKRVILRDVGMAVAAGEALCIRGASGSGKTTLLHLAAGIVKPAHGAVRLSARKIGLVFQDDRLIPWLTLAENLRFVGADRAAASAWLLAMDLAGEEGRKPAELSGGMKRRAGLARCFAVEPDLLLLDEPFAFQDARRGRRIHEAMKGALARGAAVIYTVHEDLFPLENARYLDLDGAGP
jgi:NitT/TauT family transport system ATP-binding protein